MTDPAHSWRCALRAIAAVAVDGPGLGGVVIRARAGPVRQAVETLLQALPGPMIRINPSISDLQLFGGLDISVLLAGKSVVRSTGIAGTPALIVLPMAERTPLPLAARLSQLMDAGRGHRLILLDEGAEPEEAAPAGLRDRLAVEIDLNGVVWSDTGAGLPAPGDLDAARRRFDAVTCPSDHMALLAAIAARFGIGSLRAPLMAVRMARALAALEARETTAEADLQEAAELVFASRATQVPAPPEAETQPDDTPEPAPQTGEADGPRGERPLEDRVVEAVTAGLPADVLTRSGGREPRRTGLGGSGAGARHNGNRRGRPLPSRPGRPDGRNRIDIPATLLAAAPFQRFRRARRASGETGVIIHPSDIRLRRYEDQSDRLLVFAVDASGSAAMARMAEAKGAVETLLARAYALRDVVALVAFRKTGADMLLPPTRSLVQAKRRLAGLPGGGGTPLAAGLAAAGDVAAKGRGRGLSPTLVLLTDGRANIALSGEPGRKAAAADAEATARMLRSQHLPAVVIDTAVRPGDDSARLAAWLDARYLPLPRADARAISLAADSAIGV